MKLLQILQEFEATEHFQDRLRDRFLRISYLDILAVSRDKRRLIIGKYPIPPEVKTRIEQISKKLQSSDYYCPPDIALAIEVYRFEISPRKVILNNENYREMLNTWLLIPREPPIPNNDEYNKELTRGKYLIAIVRENSITTIFLSRSKDIDFLNAGYTTKMVYIDDVDSQLDSYIDIDIARKSKPLPQPTEVKPEEPILTDKEKRLQAYKDRQKKLYGYRK
jgi:hypothetical protein